MATGVTSRATADLAAVPDPGWPGPPAEPGSGQPASQETTPGNDEELGVVWEAPVGMAADHPGPPAAPEQVYDLAAWPDLDSAGDGPADSGPGGPRAWPDLARSLYSRGWPAMDSPPSAASGWPGSGPRSHPEPDGRGSGGPGSGGPGSDGPGSDGPGSGGSTSDGPGPDGPGPDGPGSGGRSSAAAGPDGPGPDGPGSGGPGSNGLAPNSLNPNRADPSGPEPDGLDPDGPDLDTASNRPGPIGDGRRHVSSSLPCLHMTVSRTVCSPQPGTGPQDTQFRCRTGAPRSGACISEMAPGGRQMRATAPARPVARECPGLRPG